MAGGSGRYGEPLALAAAAIRPQLMLAPDEAGLHVGRQSCRIC